MKSSVYSLSPAGGLGVRVSKGQAGPDQDSLQAREERKLRRSLYPGLKHPRSRLAFQDSPLLLDGTWSLTSVY